jgi:hypothetical protein
MAPIRLADFFGNVFPDDRAPARLAILPGLTGMRIVISRLVSGRMTHDSDGASSRGAKTTPPPLARGLARTP